MFLLCGLVHYGYVLVGCNVSSTCLHSQLLPRTIEREKLSPTLATQSRSVI
uniref:Uncharacterized protein n=1 Tax=Helianthus annuus TaxID=4232 RepID=A0A251SAF4_HELAN